MTTRLVDHLLALILRVFVEWIMIRQRSADITDHIDVSGGDQAAYLLSLNV